MIEEPLINLEKILSLSTAHIYWLDHNNVYQGCNEKQAISAGLSSRFDIIGKKNCDLPWNKNDPEIVYAIDSVNLDVLKTGVSRIVEERAKLLDGTDVIFLSNKIPLRTNNEDIVGLFGISVDITSQKLQEARLKADKKEIIFALDYILAHIPAHIYWKDKNGVYLGSNDKQAKSLGLNYGYELVGKTDFGLPWKKDNAEIFRNNDLEIMSSGITKIFEESAVFNGSAATVLSQKVPLRNSCGEITGVLGISIDITDRKKAEQLQKEKEVAEKVAQTVETLAGCIAHEIRTPLSIVGINTSSIQMYLEKLFIASNKIEQKNDLQAFINNIKSAIKNAGDVIDMFLIKIRCVLSKQTSSHKFESCSIKSCINAVLSEYPFFDEERNCMIWDNKTNMDFNYMGDNLFTKHILFNLIKNALRAIKEMGRGKIYVTLRSNKNFNYLIFKDTASGIPTNVLKSLFQQFNSNTKGGTGLGLAFCKMTMQSYGGDITCESIEREYTEFVLKFPVLSVAQKKYT